MKIWKLSIYWKEPDNIFMKFERPLSRLDIEKIKKYVNGGYHIHRNPGKREKPRHTPEELDRLIEVVKKAESPEGNKNLIHPDRFTDVPKEA